MKFVKEVYLPKEEIAAIYNVDERIIDILIHKNLIHCNGNGINLVEADEFFEKEKNRKMIKELQKKIHLWI